MSYGDRKAKRQALKKKFKEMRKEHPELRGMTFNSFKSMWDVAGIQKHNHVVGENPEIENEFAEMFEEEIVEDEGSPDQ